MEVDFSDEDMKEVGVIEEAIVPGLEDISEVDEATAAKLLTGIFAEGILEGKLGYEQLLKRKALIVPAIRRNSEGEVVEETHFAFLYKGHGMRNCTYYLYKQNGRSLDFNLVFKGKFEDLRHRKKAEIEFISYCFRGYLEARGVKTRPYKAKTGK